jgi:methylmalonyl-CoA mutase
VGCEEVEELGGMTKPSSEGFQNLNWKTTAAQRNKHVLIADKILCKELNKYRLEKKIISHSRCNNQMVRKQQLAQLDRIKTKQRYRKGTGTTAKLIDRKDRQKLTK